MAESDLVRFLGYVLFLLAFVPLLFGGTIYRMRGSPPDIGAYEKENS